MTRLVLILGLIAGALLLGGCGQNQVFRKDIASYQNELPEYHFKLSSRNPFEAKGPVFSSILKADGAITEKQIQVPVGTFGVFAEGAEDTLKVDFGEGIVLTFIWNRSLRKYVMIDEEITVDGEIYRGLWDSHEYVTWVDQESGKRLRKELGNAYRYYLREVKSLPEEVQKAQSAKPAVVVETRKSAGRIL